MGGITYEDKFAKYYNDFGYPKQPFYEEEIIKNVFIFIPLEPRRPKELIVLKTGRIVMPFINIW